MKFATAFLSTVYGASIDYSSHGKNWNELDCASGDFQSPINLDTNTAELTHKISFKLVEYQDITNGTLSTPHDNS